MKVQLHPVETRVVCPVCVREIPNPDHTGTVWTEYDLTRTNGAFYCEVCRTRFTEVHVSIDMKDQAEHPYSEENR